MSWYIVWLLVFVLMAVAFSVAYTWRKGRLLFHRQTQVYQMLKDTRLELGRLRRTLEIERRARVSGDARLPADFPAQFGEDLVLYDFFKDARPGFFVEAGAYDGVLFSNTYVLESLGWRGLLVEPHPVMAERCRDQRPGSVVVECALGPADCGDTVEFTRADDPQGGAPLSFSEASSKHLQRCKNERCTLTTVNVPLRTLDSLLDDRTERVELLSLDVEGAELSVLNGFDIDRYSPAVILVELQFGSGDDAVRDLLESHGYLVAGELGCNRFFTREVDRARLAAIIEGISS